MKYFIILFILFSCLEETKNQNISIFMNDYSYEPKIAKIFSKLLRKYENFTMIFHTENRTIQYVGVVMNYITYNTSYSSGPYFTNFLVYNHDMITTEIEFIRPNISRIVNFLFTKKWRLYKSLAVPEKINCNDVVIFVAIGNGTVLKTVDRRGIEFIKLAGKTLLLEIVPHHGVTFYDICYYCGEHSMKYRYIEKTHNSHFKSHNKHFMPSQFRNLNGHKFTVVFIPYFPYVVCNRSTIQTILGTKTTVCHELRGIESEMLKTISKKLNFTFEIHIMPSDATFFDMINFISACKADIAFGGISMSVDRVPLVQFTNQYNSEEFTFLYLFSINLKEVFIKFFEPFNAIGVWLLYFAALIISSFMLFFALRTWKMHKYQDISYSDSIFLIFRASLEQASPHIFQIYRRRTSIALTLGLWWWTCLIVNTIYRSTVLSTVVNPPSIEPDDMSQLLKAGYRIAANRQFADIVKDILTVPDPIYREALRRTDYGTDTCNVFEKILHDQIAMLDEVSTIQFEIREACPSPVRDIIKWLRIGRHGLLTTGHAWATQRGAPFRTAIDYYLNLIISGGHFKKWTASVTTNYRKTMIARSREVVNKKFRSLSIKRFYPLIAIYLIGIIISILAFLCEIVYSNTVHSNR